jgi:acyl-CoA dehydrogenase
MFFEFSDKAKAMQEQLMAFMDKYIYPNEPVYFQQLSEGNRWKAIPLLEDLKEKAKAEGLWNLFLPESEYGAELTNYEYAPLCEIMGRRIPAIWKCWSDTVRKNKRNNGSNLC